MSDFPTTQFELLGRVRDQADQRAWDQFVVLYRPALYRFARRRGLQEADAHDLIQNVLKAVAEKVKDWQPDGQAKFRTWLSRIALNQAVTMYRKRRLDAAKGGSSVVNLLSEQADSSNESEELSLQYRREAFRYAARIVREQVEETTWQAFWMTTVEGSKVEDAANSLGLSVGAIYTSRSRVMRRLQETVKRIELEDETVSLELNPDEQKGSHHESL